VHPKKHRNFAKQNVAAKIFSFYDCHDSVKLRQTIEAMSWCGGGDQPL
jgi:hypothetical protein